MIKKHYGIFPHHFNYFENYLINVINNLKYVLIKFEDIDKWHEIFSILLNKNIINVDDYTNFKEDIAIGIKIHKKN